MEAVALSDSLLRAMGNHRMSSGARRTEQRSHSDSFVVVGRISMECKHGFSDREALLFRPHVRDFAAYPEPHFLEAGWASSYPLHLCLNAS